MAKLLSSWWFISFLFILVSRIDAHSVTYDHSFTHECLAKPLKPQYNGGIIVNTEPNKKLDSCVISGDANATKECIFSQKLLLENTKLYTFSAWLKVSDGNTDIGAVVKTSTYNQSVGTVFAQHGCWSMLKGGFIANASGPAELLFRSINADVDIYADSISLQPFTEQEWKSHQDKSIEKVRKSRVKFQVVDQHNRPISNATVTIKQRRPSFPFGTAITLHILENPKYRDWFFSRFRYTVFENEMKWYANEIERGVENYTICDAMVRLAQSHGVAIRGHNVFWDHGNLQPEWVPALSSDELRVAADKRIKSVMNRYKGQLIHWDVMNENLHWNFFETKLGPNASNVYYEMANKLDGKALPFLNEYNTVEHAGDVYDKATPSKYLQRIWQMRKMGYNGPLGIGLQAHFSTANLPYVRSTIDQLASAKLPIWITELDVKSVPNQALYLEQITRELHSHSAVEGIMMWAAWKPEGCYAMCLTDNNFKNLDTGDVVDKIISEWTHAADSPGTTNAKGLFGTSLFHGDYEATVSIGSGDKHSCSQDFSVLPNKGSKKTIRFKINI
ncbi:hypothetical protein ABFS83_14G102300 [Erythranthe nasuta]